MIVNALRLIYPESVPPSLRVLDLGMQEMHGMRADYAALLTRLTNGRLQPEAEGALRHTVEDWERRCLANAAIPFAREIFEVAELDYRCVDLIRPKLLIAKGRRLRGADIVADLNTAKPPAALRRTCDIVMNIGTTEHVFNQWNCFEYIHDATRVGGAMIHFLPMDGYMFHCLFKYDPKFFLLLAEANGYEPLYIGFGDREQGRPFDDRCRSWANYAGVAKTRFDCHVLEIILRKVRDKPFRPPVDLVSDDLFIRQEFTAPLPSLREGVTGRPPAAEAETPNWAPFDGPMPVAIRQPRGLAKLRLSRKLQWVISRLTGIPVAPTGPGR
jgi:hypothetical protein